MYKDKHIKTCVIFQLFKQENIDVFKQFSVFLYLSQSLRLSPLNKC